MRPRVTGVTPTVTYPSHTTLVTGVAPAVHGILNNTPFDPLGENAGGWYWYADDIKVPTLWDVAGDAGLVTANVDWPVTVGARIRHNIVQYLAWRAVRGSQAAARPLHARAARRGGAGPWRLPGRISGTRRETTPSGRDSWRG